MNRSILQNTQSSHRQIETEGPRYKEQVQAWTARILEKQPCVPDGYRFAWSRGPDSATNTAMLYDAIMCNLQYAQSQLHHSVSLVGKQSYVTSLNAAHTLKYVLQELLPLWTFKPQEVYNLPDTTETDIYGHYCLSRAIAYDAIGKADLVGTPRAQIVAASNAAHLYCVAAQSILGDIDQILNKAQICTANALVQWGQIYMDRWERDDDAEGAAKALACYKEAHSRYLSAEHHGCEEKVAYATERNQVHWLEPKLPPWETLVRARVTSL